MKHNVEDLKKLLEYSESAAKKETNILFSRTEKREAEYRFETVKSLVITIYEMEKYLNKAKILLHAADCPQCKDKSGAYYDNEGKASQCQLCYEVKEIAG